MELQHVNVKIFVDGDLPFEPARFIDVFHAWIREETLNELLIDVADYRHVPHGPGVLLVGHEADYSMDQTGGRFGLRYNRKAPLDGSNEDRLRQALGSAAHACQLLETHFENDGPLKFNRTEFELFINDRALAPNTSETFDACKPLVESFVSNVLGDPECTVEHNVDSRSRFGVVVRLPQPFEFSAFSTK